MVLVDLSRFNDGDVEVPQVAELKETDTADRPTTSTSNVEEGLDQGGNHQNG